MGEPDMKKLFGIILVILLLVMLLPEAALSGCICDPDEHNWGSWKYYDFIENLSTGEIFEGTTARRPCLTCGKEEVVYSFADGRVIREYLGNNVDPYHEWSDWKVTKEATCAEEGIKTRTCSNCGKTKTATIPAGNHRFGDWVVTTKATCGEKGVRTRTCTVCGKTETETYSDSSAHHFGDWTVTKEASCQQNGTKTRTCTACGKTETESIPKSSAHQFGDWEVTKEATCTKGGKEKCFCKLCGASKTRDIEKLGHSYSEYQITVEATDCSMGRRSSVCARCGHSIDEDFYPEGTLYKGGDNPPEAVMALQRALADLGLYNKKIVGEYGNGTVSAVSKFEKNYLGMKGDGIAWPKVLRALGVAGKGETDSGDDREAVSSDTSGVKLLLEARRISSLTGSFAAGDTITIQWTLTNRSEKGEASSIRVYRFAGMKADKKKDAVIAEPEALAPGGTVSGTCEYTVTASDAEAGRFTVGFIARGKFRKKDTDSNRVWFNFRDGVADTDEFTAERHDSADGTDDTDSGAPNGSDKTDDVEVTTIEWISPAETADPQSPKPDNPDPAAGACGKLLTAAGDGTSEYTVVICAQHAGTAAEVKRRMDAGEYSQACALWDAEIDALFAEWIGKTDAEGAGNAVEEQAAFGLQLKSLESALRLICEEEEVAAVAAEERMNECVRLCGELHTAGSAPAAGSAAQPDSEAVKACGHRITWQETGAAHIVDQQCETHRETSRLVGRLLENAAGGEDRGFVWQRARDYWMQELNAMYDIWYMSADESGRGMIMTSRVSFGQLVEARQKTLAGLYPDDPAAAEEILTRMIIERAGLLCRMLHGAGILTD